MKRETPRGSTPPCRNRVGRCMAAAVFLLLMPVLIYAQPWQGQSGPPPIAAPLVRAGDLAFKLMPALGLGPASDEVMAESRLIGVDIQPRNGWIADYPVTPDIVDELVRSVGEAADSGRLLPMGRGEALRRLTDVLYGAGLAAAPDASGAGYGAADSDASGYYPDAAALDNYYETEGPPVSTYYAPPSAYYDLYSFVPCPFLYSGARFPGFYILRDFHRTVNVNGRRFFCSNHYHDFRSHTFQRIDPLGRFNGRPYAGVSPANGRSAAFQANNPGLRSGSMGAPVRGGNAMPPAMRGASIALLPGAGVVGQSPMRGISAPSYRPGPRISPTYPRAVTAPPSYRGAMTGPPYHASYHPSYNGVGTSSGRSTGFAGRSTGFSAGGGSFGGRGGGSGGRSGGSSGRGGGHR